MNKNLTTRKNNNEISPWSVFRDDLWELFDRFSKDFDMPVTFSQDRFVPKIEMKDTGKAYQICAEVPGMDEKDINVTLSDNQLIIEGEKKKETKDAYHSELSYGRFYRSIPLNSDIDSEKVQATYKNGVLSIEVAKHPERTSKNKKVQINAGVSGQETKH